MRGCHFCFVSWVVSVLCGVWSSSREEPRKMQVSSLHVPYRHIVYASVKESLVVCRLSLVAFRLSTHVRVIITAVRSDLENRVFMRTCRVVSFVGLQKR